MKILYVQPGGGIGGSMQSLYQILKALPGEYESQVVLDRASDPGYHTRVRPLVSACHLLPLPTWQRYHRRTIVEHARAPLADAWRLLGCILAALKIARLIRQERIDLVHTNNSMTPSGALAAWLTRVPHIWHVREAIGLNRQYPLLMGQVSLRLMNLLSCVVICNSHYTAEVFRNEGNRVRVIVNGLDLEDFTAGVVEARDLRETCRVAPGEIVVGMAGNLTTIMKRHDLFLDIAALVTRSAPQTKFIIFGGSTDLDQTEYTRSLRRKVSELGLEERITWVDFEDDIPAIMRAIDILIHPALTEGSGRVVMEAMASGKPVVAFCSGGVKELIDDGNTGFLVDPAQPAKAAEIILHLLRDPEARAIIGEAAREHANQNFSTTTMMQHLVEVYQAAARQE